MPKPNRALCALLPMLAVMLLLTACATPVPVAHAPTPCPQIPSPPPSIMVPQKGDFLVRLLTFFSPSPAKPTPQ